MLTSAQIITLACQAAKVPGFTTQAGQFLNARLVQIALQQDLDIVRRKATINLIIGQQQYALPANYLRARVVQYYLNGVSYDLDQKSIQEYLDLFQGPGILDYPYLFATDVSGSLSGSQVGNVASPQIYFYPQPIVALPVTVLYMDSAVEIPNPATSQLIPWFPDQRQLIHAVTEDLMLLTDDARIGGVSAKTDMMMQGYLKMDNDKEQRVEKVKLDTDNFRTSRRNIRPTKLQGD